MENEQIEEKTKNNPLIIDEMMINNDYYPKNKEFESKNNEITENNNFSLIFAHFLKFINSFDSNFTAYFNKLEINNVKYILDIKLRSYLLEELKLNDKEIKEYTQYWKQHNEYNLSHTCIFLLMADKYIKKISNHKFSDYDKNILYWTILFHDMGKHMNIHPSINEKIGKYKGDKTHPFKSTIIFLNLMFEKNLFYYPNDNYKNDLIHLYKNEFSNSLFKSWKMEKIKKNKIYNISFKYIDIFEKFFNKIKEELKNEWIYDICVLIIFHQSLPNNDKKMNEPLLEEKYIKIFFTRRLIEFMRIIMIYDSSSHSLSEGGVWSEQINKHIDELLKLFN